MNVNDIQPGMDIVCTATEMIGHDITFFENLHSPYPQPRYFSHAVKILGQAPGDRIVWESTLPVVKQTTLEKWLEANPGPISAVLLDSRHPWTPEANSRAWTIAQQYEGRWYDGFDLPALAAWLADGRLGPPPVAIWGLVCSVFVTTINKAAFLPDFPEFASINPNGYTPDDIEDAPWSSGILEVER